MSVLLAGSVGFGIYSDAQQTITSTKSSLRTLANTMVSNIGNKIANARQTLERLSDRPLVRQVDPKNCDGILKDLLNLNPDYANVTYTNMDGVAVCSAVPQPDGKPVNVGKAPWFEKFVKEQRFIVGDPFFGPITRKWVSVLSAPIWNEHHEMVGGVQLPLDLKAYDPKIHTQFLPAGSRYGFVSEQGVLIWRNVDPEGLVGTRLEGVEAARRVIEVRDGEFESVGSDGIARSYSVVPMPETGWIAFVGIPLSEVYGAAKRRAINATAIALGAITLLVALALSITRRITEPIVALEKATHSVLNGNFGTKVTPDGPSEVASVATAFNAMTDKIEASTRRLETEINERERMEVQVRQMAFHDQLTNLPNRRLLEDRLGQSMAASKRSGCYGAVMFLDLDNFKPLNDAYGHVVGDLLLIEAADRLKSCVREVDTVARFGGDEFVVIISELDVNRTESKSQAKIIAEKVRDTLSKFYLLTVKHRGKPDTTVEHRCTVSVGVALLHSHEDNQNDILRWADTAMYRAKEAGRNLIHFYDD